MTKPLILITNDDGIDAPFMHVVAHAFASAFDVHVVAPSAEQSWTGRSFTRYGELSVEARTDLPWPAHAVSGTPSDCVNLALGQILPRKPALVVSGINIGFNVTVPLVLTSGTVAAAVESAIWGIPSMALSHAVPRDEFEPIKDGAPLSDERQRVIQSAARHALSLTDRLGLLTPPIGHDGIVVHNVNFPIQVTETTKVEATQLAHIRLGPLFGQRETGRFSFEFPRERHPVFLPENADVACLERGNISYTRIDFAQLGRLEQPAAFD
ncbi:MAG: 5'/3'-nucleotidase SurE [Myxococcota bacterium]|nr:5'/3'-nucleotidase SurE [Myxococcota bacterium]